MDQKNSHGNVIFNGYLVIIALYCIHYFVYYDPSLLSYQLLKFAIMLPIYPFLLYHAILAYLNGKRRLI